MVCWDGMYPSRYARFCYCDRRSGAVARYLSYVVWLGRLDREDSPVRWTDLRVDWVLAKMMKSRTACGASGGGAFTSTAHRLRTRCIASTGKAKS